VEDDESSIIRLGFLPADFDEVLCMIDAARSRAVASVNTQLIDLHWQIGEHISRKIATRGWGEGTVKALADYIRRRQPNARGFSAQNLWRMRQFYETYRDESKLSALLRELYPDDDAIFKDTYLLDFLDLPPEHSESDLQSALVDSCCTGSIWRQPRTGRRGRKSDVNAGESAFCRDPPLHLQEQVHLALMIRLIVEPVRNISAQIPGRSLFPVAGSMQRTSPSHSAWPACQRIWFDVPAGAHVNSDGCAAWRS
jgi:predicted nuclease of restriction endonuclease-like (RecB) superfamily